MNRYFLTLILIVAALCLLPALLSAQLSDLDLLTDDDRSFGLSVNRAPDPMKGSDTETQSAILLLPISRGVFQGGAGAYWTRSIADESISSALQWRVQGGPQFLEWLGVQFYVEGFWKQGIDYGGFVRVGTFDRGRFHLSGGFGTLVRADTETTLATGIERTAAAGGDTVVKGLLLASVDVDTEMFETLRVLGTVLPGSKTDVIGEAQVSYALDRINLTGFGRIGYERGEVVRRYTGLVQLPF